MKLETFFENFELFADVPDAVATLRQLILESAIRGRLVPQNAHDKPVSKLITRQADSKKSRARKRFSLTPVCDDAYLDLPPRWTWIRLGNTGRIFNGNSVNESGKTELAKVKDGLPFIATKDVGYGRDALVYNNGLKVPIGDTRFRVAREHAVLICAEGGSAGRKIGITDRDICFGNKLYANEVREGIHHRFIFYVYQSPTFYKQFTSRMTGIISGIARSEFLSLPIPLPPEEEQKRIVAKVDALMALCDRLKAQQQERKEKHAALARASLARFADAPTPANLNFIFHKSYDISPADLCKSILTLAIQGKLVPQYPNDEPAEDLITMVRNAALESGYRGRTNSEDDNNSKFVTHVPANLPPGWGVCPLEDLFKFIDYRGRTPVRRPSGVRLITAKNVKKGFISNEPIEFIDEDVYPKWMTRGFPRKGDLLFVTEGHTMGFVGMLKFDFKYALAQRTIDLQPFCGDYAPFYLYYLLSEPFQTAIVSNTTGSAAQGIKAAKLKRIRVIVPPLAEQRRIVAKVDQLMSLVDELETQLASSRTTGEKLLSTLVAELTSGKESNVTA